MFKSLEIEAVVEIIKRNNIEELSKHHAELTSTYFNILEQDQIRILKYKLNTRGLTALHIAAFYDSLESYVYIERNIFRNTKFQDILDIENNTPLHFAIFTSALEIAYYIISNHPNEVSRISLAKYEYLHLAAMNNSIELVEILIERGAILPFNNEAFWNLVYSKKNLKLIKLIMKSINANHRYDDSTILMKALLNDFKEIIPMLIKTDPKPNYINENGITPLIICIDFLKNIKYTQMLLDVISGNPDIPANSDHMPLVHYLCKCDNIKIIELVLERGIDVNRLDKAGNIGPVYIQCLKPDIQIKVMNLLLNYNYNVNLHKPGHNTALGECLLSYQRNIKLIELLIEKGSDLNLPFYSKVNQNMTIKDKIIELSKKDKDIYSIIQKYKNLFE